MHLPFFNKYLVKNLATDLYNLNGSLMAKRRQKNRPLTDKSADIRNGLIKNYVLPLYGDISLQNLSIRIIDERLVSVKSIAGAKDLSGNTKNIILHILNDIFNQAIENGLKITNPIESVMRFSQTITNFRGAIPIVEMDLLFPKTHEGLIKIWRKQIYVVAYLILKDTGLRPGELRALAWADWYPDYSFFPITKAIESGKRDKIKCTKTGSVKPAVVSDQTAKEIDLLYNSVNNHSPNDFIFCDKNGPFTIGRIVYNFKKGVTRAGLNRPDYSPYWLRHTFNTRALDDLPDDIVRLLMGHATEGMTRHYRHPDIESLKKEAARIREMYFKINNKSS